MYPLEQKVFEAHKQGGINEAIGTRVRMAPRDPSAAEIRQSPLANGCRDLHLPVQTGKQAFNARNNAQPISPRTQRRERGKKERGRYARTHPRGEYWGFRHGDRRMISVQFHASSVNISGVYERRRSRCATVRSVYLHKLPANQGERGPRKKRLGRGLLRASGHMSPMHPSAAPTKAENIGDAKLGRRRIQSARSTVKLRVI